MASIPTLNGQQIFLQQQPQLQPQYLLQQHPHQYQFQNHYPESQQTPYNLPHAPHTQIPYVSRPQSQHQQPNPQRGYQDHSQDDNHHQYQQYPLPPTIASDPGIDESSDPIETLNLRVLQQYIPRTTSLIFRAPYAVVYTFSASTSSWEKIGKEGTLFIVRLSSTSLSSRQQGHNSEPDKDTAEVGGAGEDETIEHYAAIVLNRRGMENWVLNLDPTADEEVDYNEQGDSTQDDGTVQGGVQVEGEYIILQGLASLDGSSAPPPPASFLHITPKQTKSQPGGGIGAHRSENETEAETEVENEPEKEVYGLWVFEEGEGSTKGKRVECATALRECKKRTSWTRKIAREKQRASEIERRIPQDHSISQSHPSFTQLPQRPQQSKFQQQQQHVYGEQNQRRSKSPDLMALLQGNAKAPPAPAAPPPITAAASQTPTTFMPTSSHLTTGGYPYAIGNSNNTEAGNDILGQLFRNIGNGGGGGGR